MCRYSDNGNSCNYFGYPDIYTARRVMSEQHGPGLTNKFDKYTSDHRNVESGCNKYGDSRDNGHIRLHRQQANVLLLRQ